MILRLTKPAKLVFVFICLLVSVAGFMVKLPARFHDYDKELHATFYFIAAAILNLLFARRNMLIHAVIFLTLYLFGVGIEYAQEFSNIYFHSRIHGRFDPEDLKYNLRGLLVFSGVWLPVVGVLSIIKVSKSDKSATIEEDNPGLLIDIEMGNAFDQERVRLKLITANDVKRINTKGIVKDGRYWLCINEQISTQLNLRVMEKRTGTLPDGTIVEREISGPVEVKVNGRQTICNAIVLPGESAILLGTLLLQDLELEIDLKKQSLIINHKKYFFPM